jgi:dinuclear metal center YbgI/SA1388 family protein
MKASEIISAIEEFAPLSSQESWDNTGLSVGDPGRDITSVLLSLDCTPSVIDEALLFGAGMVVTHHPLIFSPLKQLSIGDPIGKMIIKAVKNDLVLYSAHTNMDRVTGGVSWMMAEKLSLQNVELLSGEKEESAGLGVVGNLPSPLLFDQLLKVVKEKFGVRMVKCSENHKKIISRIALCGGSGSSLIPLAVSSGADLFITGDIGYHHFFCYGETAVMDIGHFESETVVLDLIKALLTKKFPNFAVRIAEKNINPIQYY